MKRLVFSLSAAWLVFSASAMAQTRYTITDLAPSEPFTNSSASGINNNGFVTGTLSETSPYGSSRAVLWDNVHAMHDLGALGEEENSWGYGLNDSDRIVGEGTHIGYHLAISCIYPFPFERLDLTGFDDSRAYAVSNSIMIVGQRDGKPYEFLCMGYFDDRSGAAYDVNDKNYAVGYITTPTNPKDIGKLWNYPTGAPVRTMKPAAGFLESKAHGINEDGDLVVGSSWDGSVSYEQVACVWQENESLIMWDAIPLPNLYEEGDQWSYASEVNNSGTIVGYWTSDLIDDGEKRACVWVQDSLGDHHIYDLNELVDDWYNEWTLIEAVDINESGQIVGLMARYVGDGEGDGYEYHGFLLTPVPEPAASAMLALPALLGTSGLLIRRAVRRRLRHTVVSSF